MTRSRTKPSSTISEAARRAIRGTDAHVEALDVFAGLAWRLAGERPAGAPHSIFQLTTVTTPVRSSCSGSNWASGRLRPVV